VKLDEQANEHRVVLRYEKDKPLRYHIQSKWLKGIRFSCCPSAQDWEEILQHIGSTELPGVGNGSDALY